VWDSCHHSSSEDLYLELKLDKCQQYQESCKLNSSAVKTRPHGWQHDMPPTDGSSNQKSRRIYVHPWTCPQSTYLRWPAVAKLQAASVPIPSQLRHGTDRQTDGSHSAEMPASDGGDIISTHYKHTLLCSVDVVVGVLQQFRHDGLNVFTDVAGLCQRRAVTDGKRNFQTPRQSLCQQRLTCNPQPSHTPI